MRPIVSALSVAALILGAGLTALYGQTQTQSTLPDRVEEDWELVIATPDPAAAGPQIATSMSPTADDSSPFVEFDVNFRQSPNFQAGGLQVQVWSEKRLLDSSSSGTDQCNTPNETITWTQSMSLSGGSVAYAIKNGQSTTWGQFGQDNQLSVSYTSGLSALDGYSPDTSVTKSGVTWESNYVTSLRLVQVRYYAAGKLIMTDMTARSVPLGD